MKTNFRKEEKDDFDIQAQKTIINNVETPGKELTVEEFESWVVKSGAKGSFMIYRTSTKPDQELGIDEL